MLASASLRLQQTYGLLRSLRMYYAAPGATRRLDRFYGGFVRRGDLCFDLGAHVGNRTRCFRRLGARVVAVEPQPLFARLLRGWIGRDRDVVVLEQAVGAAEGELELHISPMTPTVTTGSRAFIAGVNRSRGFDWVRWTRTHRIEQTTLDRLIERFGDPDFVKIDVEGMEDAVLAGVSRPLRQVSFEFIPSCLDVTDRCLGRLAALGRYRFNASLGEQQSLIFDDWVDEPRLRAWLSGFDLDGPSGDICARLEGRR